MVESIKQLNPLIPILMETNSPFAPTNIIFIDMITEKSYWLDGSEVVGDLGEEIKKIIIAKKSQPVSPDMDLVDRVNQVKSIIFEKEQNARSVEDQRRS